MDISREGRIGDNWKGKGVLGLEIFGKIWVLWILGRKGSVGVGADRKEKGVLGLGITGREKEC